MKQFGTFIWNTIYTLVVLAVLALALLFVGTKVSLLGYEVKVVQSGSMEPAILTGSLVVITNAAEYMLGDVVTYGEDGSNPIKALSGSIALEMGRFLHVDADLRYVSSESGAPRIYPMRERRRVRRGELHYLDSPRLGLLARVVRVDD